ncbi:hypothetical protein [Pediococcus acidilactici]|jgi:hypothetical protein|uniref:hypothetical protein n=1 Tax=Pediococcus acidilactici TaxID=1254 RepID=UPI0007EFF8E2|nr:hypothetical protein [Pediococcus acidilactici]APR28535.1 hypothetical protein BTW26_05705 [Pediococcus acidilactici]ARW24493.1 hypothetical protein S100424_01057 [Pediococcus acidilactici]ARW26532.1 hypothetical protein S100313_01097 [Pediococcus acidilactici]ARW28611.1 hypothetical protein S101189_01057 [Pediococcus acidilactici]KAF0334578.1 hypothetical protein GBO20_07780 [Pediococcus acidilactici]
MKKITLAAAMLITLSSLGIAGGAKAAIVTGPTDANITVSEGNSAIELSGVKDIAFDFNNITKETRTFKETEPINADVINKTFGEKEYTLSVEKNFVSAGLDAQLVGSKKIGQALNDTVNGDLVVNLDATKYTVPGKDQSNTVKVVVTEAPVEDPIE